MGRLAVVRGAGDLATGVIQALATAGFTVVALEIPKPTAIRRTVALSSCRYSDDLSYRVENLEGRWVDTPEAAEEILAGGERFVVPVLNDPEMASLAYFQPDILVDAIIAKKNFGLSADRADIVVALGPGFTAPQDCDLVVETMRGHNLGRLIFDGAALPNTGIPGLIKGEGKRRVMHAPASGTLTVIHDIGSVVNEGDVIAQVGETPVYATLSGVVRGMLPPGFDVWKGLKTADIDPRPEAVDYWHSISDKARSLGGAVVTGICALTERKEA